MKLEYIYGSAYCYTKDWGYGDGLNDTEFLTPDFGAIFKSIGAGKEREAVFKVTLTEIEDETQDNSEVTTDVTTPPPLNEEETTSVETEMTTDANAPTPADISEQDSAETTEGIPSDVAAVLIAIVLVILLVILLVLRARL